MTELPAEPAESAVPKRTPSKRKARELAKYLRGEHPDYAYQSGLSRPSRRARHRSAARA